MAVHGLGHVDAHFPIVKEDTQTIQEKISGLVYWPYNNVKGGKDYVFGLWGKEYNKCGADGVVAAGKATITTSLMVTSDVCSWISDFVIGKKREAEGAIKEKANN